MPKDKQGGAAGAASSGKRNKKRFPSLLSKVKSTGSGAARLIPFHKRTNVKKQDMPPPVTSVTADYRQDKISDLTTPPEPRTAAPPVQQIESLRHSATSSLTLSAVLNRSHSGTIHTDATENLTQNQLLQPLGTKILPKTPKTSNEKKHLELNSGIRLNAPSPVTLDKYEVQTAGREPAEPPVTMLSSDTSSPSQQLDPPQQDLYSDEDFLNSTLKDESSIGSGSKPKAKKLAFSKVKALLRQVQQKLPQPDDRKPGSANLVPGIPVTTTGDNSVDAPVIEAAYSFRESPSKGSVGGNPSSPEPTKRSRHLDHLPAASPSSSSLIRRISVDPDNAKMASPSPNGKSSRRSLSPQLSVGFGNTGSERTPQRGLEPSTSPVRDRLAVDAPEEDDEVFNKWSPLSAHDEPGMKEYPTRVVGIPVDGQAFVGNATQAYDAHLESLINRGPFKFNPFDSDSSAGIDKKLETEDQKLSPSKHQAVLPVVKSTNPFDSSSSEASEPQRSPRNPFDSSDDEEEEDVFAAIVSSAQKTGRDDNSEDDGIPEPNYKFLPSPTEARKKSRKTVSPKPLIGGGNPGEENQEEKAGEDSKSKTKKPVGRVKVLVDKFSGQQENLPGIVDLTGASSHISSLDQSLRQFPARMVEEKRGVADISHLDETAAVAATKGETTTSEQKQLSPALADSSTETHTKSSKGDIFASDSPLTKILVGRLVNDRKGDGVDSAYRKQRLEEKAAHVDKASDYQRDPRVLDHAPSEIYRMTMETPRISNGVNFTSDASGVKLGGASISAGSAACYSENSPNLQVNEEAQMDAADVYLSKLQQGLGPSFADLSSPTKSEVEIRIQRMSPTSMYAIQRSMNIEVDPVPFNGASRNVTSKNDGSDAVDHPPTLIDKTLPQQKLNQVFKKLRDSRTSSKASSGSSTKSDASVLLSQLEDFGTTIKNAAKKSLIAAEKDGSSTPPWTQELVDLTGITSFEDLEDEEAVWLFEIGSDEQHDIKPTSTPKSDLESVMQFAAKRLGLAVDDNGTKSVLSNEEALSAVVQGLLPKDGEKEAEKETPVGNKSDRLVDSIVKEMPQSPPQTNSGSPSKHNESVAQQDINHNQVLAELNLSKSSFEDTSHDKYVVSDSEEDNYADGEYETQKASNKSDGHQPLDESDVSSSDNLSVIMSKLQRDCSRMERRRAQLKIETESRTEHWADETASQQEANSTRKDFLEVLLESTGALFCGQRADSYVQDSPKDYKKNGRNSRRPSSTRKQRKTTRIPPRPEYVHEARQETLSVQAQKSGSTDESVEVDISVSEHILSSTGNDRNGKADSSFLEMEPSPANRSDNESDASLQQLSEMRVPRDPDEVIAKPDSRSLENQPHSLEIESANATKSSDAHEETVLDGSDNRNHADILPHSVQPQETNGEQKPEDIVPEHHTAVSPNFSDLVPLESTDDERELAKMTSNLSDPGAAQDMDHSMVTKPSILSSQLKSQDTLDIVFESTASRDTTGYFRHSMRSNETEIDQCKKADDTDRSTGLDVSGAPPTNDEIARRSALLQPLGFFVPESSSKQIYMDPLASQKVREDDGPSRKSESEADIHAMGLKTHTSCDETTIQLLAKSDSAENVRNPYGGDGTRPDNAIVIEDRVLEHVQSVDGMQGKLSFMQIGPAISLPQSSPDEFDDEAIDGDINFAISPSTTSSPKKKQFTDEVDSVQDNSAEKVPGEISVQERAMALSSQEPGKNVRDDRSKSSIDLIPDSFLKALGLGGESVSAKSGEGNLELSRDVLATLEDSDVSDDGESASLLLALTRSETDTFVSGSSVNPSQIDHPEESTTGEDNENDAVSPSFSERKSRRLRLQRAKDAVKKARTPRQNDHSTSNFEFERAHDSASVADSKQRSTTSQINSVLGRLNLANDNHVELDDRLAPPPEMTMTTSLSPASSTDENNVYGINTLELIDAEALYYAQYSGNWEADTPIDVIDLMEELDEHGYPQENHSENDGDFGKEVAAKSRLDAEHSNRKKKSPVPGVVPSSSSGDNSTPTPLLQKVVDRMKRGSPMKEPEVAPCSSGESSEIDELFRRYDTIVKDMVVLDDNRLAKAQARQIANIVEAADIVVRDERAKHENVNDLEQPKRRQSTGGLKLQGTHDSMIDKVLQRRTQEPIRRSASSGSLALRQNASMASDDGSHPSQKARELREQIEEALQASAAIRTSQKELTNELTSFQSRIQQRRASSPGHSPVSRSAPSSPFGHRKSYYHRNCACARAHEEGECELDNSSDAALQCYSVSPSHIVRQYSTEEEEEIQSQRVESILSGLRKADSAASVHSQGFRKSVASPRRRRRHNSNAF